MSVSQLHLIHLFTSFEMPLALKFKSGSQEKTVVVNNTNNNEFFSEEIGFKADTVIIDPDYWIFSKNNVSIKDIALTIPASGYEVNVFPVPTS